MPKIGVYIAAPILAWLVAQGIKVLISLRQDGLQVRDAVQSGGMPSSHSAFMAALTVALGFGEGFESAFFAMSLCLSGIIFYDATSVRRATGQQSAAIYEIARKSKITLEQPIVEARGHTWPQVFAGIVVGVLVGIIVSLWL